MNLSAALNARVPADVAPLSRPTRFPNTDDLAEDDLMEQPVSSPPFSKNPAPSYMQTRRAWFVADWQLCLSGLMDGRLAVVIDISTSADVLYVWFREEPRHDPSWMFHPLQSLSTRIGSPDLLITAQEKLYPSLLICGARMRPAAKTILDVQATQAEPIRRCVESLTQQHRYLSDRLRCEYEADLAFQVWRARVNAFGLPALTPTLD